MLSAIVKNIFSIKFIQKLKNMLRGLTLIMYLNLKGNNANQGEITPAMGNYADLFCQPPTDASKFLQLNLGYSKLTQPNPIP